MVDLNNLIDIVIEAEVTKVESISNETKKSGTKYRFIIYNEN